MEKAQINVVIPKSGRDSHLNLCLYYLDKAASLINHSVVVYVVDTSSIEVPVCKHITVTPIVLPRKQPVFNKSELLNYGLEVMDKDFWFVSIIDVDMLYVKDFFLRLQSTVTNKTYIFSTGVYLDQEETNNFLTTKKEINKVVGNYPEVSGPSQVTLHNELLQLFKDIYGDKLYCEDFNGWGGEDSDLSYRSRDMERNGLIVRKELRYMWYHMYHNNHRINCLINKALYVNRKAENKKLLDNFLHRINKEVPNAKGY